MSHLASSVHVSSLEAPLLAPVSTMLKHTLEAILEAAVQESTWGLASQPVREGGLGLRDPLVEAAPSRLAALLKATSLALELGAHPDYVDHETAHAK